MKKFLLIALTILSAAVLAFGQTPTGSIKGVVSAADGVVPNASVTVKYTSPVEHKLQQLMNKGLSVSFSGTGSLFDNGCG